MTLRSTKAPRVKGSTAVQTISVTALHTSTDRPGAAAQCEGHQGLHTTQQPRIHTGSEWQASADPLSTAALMDIDFTWDVGLPRPPPSSQALHWAGCWEFCLKEMQKFNKPAKVKGHSRFLTRGWA